MVVVNIIFSFYEINGCAIDVIIILFLCFRGCFLTSSLIGTLAMTLQIPLAMLLDMIFRKKIYPLMFYLGSLPMFLSLIFVSMLMKYDDCDPVMKFIKLAYRKLRICRQTSIVRFVYDT